MTLLVMTGCMNLIVGKAKRNNFKLLLALREFSMKAHGKQHSDNGRLHTQITRQRLMASKIMIYELKNSEKVHSKESM